MTLLVSVRLFSRRSGYVGGDPQGFFHTDVFNVSLEDFGLIEDKSGRSIRSIIEKMSSSLTETDKMVHFCGIYPDWYCYRSDMIITKFGCL